MPIFVKIKGLKGDVTTEGYDKGDFFVADSFSFGVEREMKESGEKGGTEDINIGIGELQECTISKSMDSASAKLAQFAINGNSCGTAEIHFVEVAGGGQEASGMRCYLLYKLDRCFIKSWSTSGDADDRPTEEVAFYYNKIAFAYSPTKTGSDFESQYEMKWDNVKNKPWDDHGINLLG
jgi:type VI secretion system secreted protein Hcp